MPPGLRVPHAIEVVDRAAAIVLEFVEAIGDGHSLPNLTLRGPEAVVDRDLLSGDSRKLMRPRIIGQRRTSSREEHGNTQAFVHKSAPREMIG
jgi:hypothetical protein